MKRGATVDAMADQLEQAGVIRSAALFKLWARARRLQLIRGEYTFEPRASLSEVANKLKRGDIHYTSITVPPGSHAWAVQHRFKDFIPEEVFWTLWKSPRLAQAAGFPRGREPGGPHRPGHLPGEPRPGARGDLPDAMAETFRDKVRPTLEGGALPPYQTLILASMVEKETALPEELPRVAGVYAQRLHIGMRLQCDPTSLYARWMSGDLRFTGPAPEDVRRPSPLQHLRGRRAAPHAHRRSPAPPPSRPPRCPGLGQDLYFVATGQGGHSFAPSLAEHNHNVGLYRKETPAEAKAWPMARVRIDQLLVAAGPLRDPEPRPRPASWPGTCWWRTAPSPRPGPWWPRTRAIRLRGEALPFVSRGGLKLAHALPAFGVDPAGPGLLRRRRQHRGLHRLPPPARRRPGLRGGRGHQPAALEAAQLVGAATSAA